MNAEQLLKLETWFTKYVSTFYERDKEKNQIFQLKEEHTKRVCNNILWLGKSIHLSQADLRIVKVAALFHDIGRFKQYQDYGTFNDKISVNHARSGICQLSLHKILNKLPLVEKRLIFIPIAWHNAFKPPEIKDDKICLFIKLLRDADKLDIWNVVIDYYKTCKNKVNSTVCHDFSDNSSTFSKKIIRSIHKKKTAQTSEVNCLTDLKLLQISWAYDLNFPESYRLLKKYCYIEELACTLPQTKEVKTAVALVINHIDRMTGKNC